VHCAQTYRSLPPTVFIGARAGSGTVQDAIAIGEFLSAKKAELPYGQWGKWVEENLEFDRRTAHNYIKVFENRELLSCETVSQLTEAYRLLFSSEPEQCRGN
jgi:hypothetical protein